MIEIQKPNTIANNIRHSIVSGITHSGKIIELKTNEAHDKLFMVFVMDNEEGVHDVIRNINRITGNMKRDITIDGNKITLKVN